eukprot:1071862-Amorphochlora_amoeboformis.AAC.1
MIDSHRLEQATQGPLVPRRWSRDLVIGCSIRSSTISVRIAVMSDGISVSITSLSRAGTARGDGDHEDHQVYRDQSYPRGVFQVGVDRDDQQ